MFYSGTMVESWSKDLYHSLATPPEVLDGTPMVKGSNLDWRQTVTGSPIMATRVLNHLPISSFEGFQIQVHETFVTVVLGFSFRLHRWIITAAHEPEVLDAMAESEIRMLEPGSPHSEGWLLGVCHLHCRYRHRMKTVPVFPLSAWLTQYWIHETVLAQEPQATL